MGGSLPSTSEATGRLESFLGGAQIKATESGKIEDILDASVGGAASASIEDIENVFGTPDIEDPTLPEEADVLTEEEIAKQAEEAREFERIRLQGFQGRGSTITSGSQGATSNLQTTFKQLDGR